MPTWSWAALPGVIAFSSGDGDASYDSFFGLDVRGDALCLVTDFHVFAIDQPMALGTPETTELVSSPVPRTKSVPAVFPPEVAELEAMLAEASKQCCGSFFLTSSGSRLPSLLFERMSA